MLEAAAGALAVLALALALDALFGEPDALWRRAPHPVIAMGRAIAALERRLNRGRARRAKGVAALAALIAAAAGLGWVGEQAPFGLDTAFSVAVGAILLAQNSLMAHVRAVADGLERSLAEGRRAVSMIVGRDPEQLDDSAVARAAIESCAENFSDGVVAPAFWFAVAGAPGILVYKLVNTADSMIGHRTERFAAYGWSAARLDDALNWIPARLAGALYAVGSGSWAGAMRAIAVMRRDASLHRSPNAGWPEAAAAGALGVAVSGPRSYGGAATSDLFVNAEGRRRLSPGDIRRAVSLTWRAWAALMTLTLVLSAAFAAAAMWAR